MKSLVLLTIALSTAVYRGDAGDFRIEPLIKKHNLNLFKNIKSDSLGINITAAPNYTERGLCDFGSKLNEDFTCFMYFSDGSMDVTMFENGEPVGNGAIVWKTLIMAGRYRIGSDCRIRLVENLGITMSVVDVTPSLSSLDFEQFLSTLNEMLPLA